MLEDSLTVRRYKAYQEAWADAPPINVSVARYIGYKPKAKKGGGGYADLSDLLTMFPEGTIR